MKLQLASGQYIETSQGIDISIPLSADKNSVRAWYCDPVQIEPVMNENFIGDVNQGGSVNFRTVFLNPHGNGTHTECVGHISKENHVLNDCLKEFHFMAMVVTVSPEIIENKNYHTNDLVLTENNLKSAFEKVNKEHCTALIIRTSPNHADKKTHNYSNTNPPYLSTEAVRFIVDQGIDHLILDLPSVDRESDGGVLAGHHLFWNYPDQPQTHKTITEMAFIPDSVSDGIYLLNIQITSLVNDASPSKLVLYSIIS